MSRKCDYKDIIGQRFGRLTVVSLNSYKNQYYYYNCICDCGNSCVVLRASLTNNLTKSCGCLQRENIYKAIEKHRKALPNQVCAFCGKPHIYAKGLCINCYERMRNKGTCEYNARKTLTPKERQEKHKNKLLAKYNPTTIIGKEILQKMANGASIKIITNEYNISKQTLYNILNNKYGEIRKEWRN